MVASMNTATLRRTDVAKSFVQALMYKYTLRLCNAYPFPSALDVYMKNGVVKLNTEPLAYKACADFLPEIHAGDRVDFKVADLGVGTFTIQDLPNNDAILLMVIYRHDSLSSGVAFESHVFSNVAISQIAVLDTYRGAGKSELHIHHMLPAASKSQSEVLRFDSVVAVDPGLYEVSLQGTADDAVKAKAELVALRKEAYVVIRCGVHAEEGHSYPEDVMVFPRSDKAAMGFGSRVQPSLIASLILGAMPILSSVVRG